jgi:hypothetical protein
MIFVNMPAAPRGSLAAVARPAMAQAVGAALTSRTSIAVARVQASCGMAARQGKNQNDDHACLRAWRLVRAALMKAIGTALRWISG